MVIFRHLLEALLNPFFLCLCLFALFFIGLWFYKSNCFSRWGLLFVLFLLFLFSTGWLPQTLTKQLEDRYPVIQKTDPTVHWVVVLSGGQSEAKDKPVNDHLNGSSLKRLVEGVRLYRQLPHAKLLLSGGKYGFEVPEAWYLGEIASWFAIPFTDIVLETKSINTADEAKAIKPLVKTQRFYLVTSAIHMYRAMNLFEAQGLHPIPAPTDYTYYWNNERWAKVYIPNPYNLFYLSIAMHELLGGVWSKWHGDYVRHESS